MTTLTIQTVDPDTRTWDKGQNGPIEFIQGQFTNGEGWSLGAKPENAAKRVAELTALIGVEGEYELEPKGEFRGKPQWKLKGWPGKPVFGGGGGGGNKAPRDETGMAIGAAGHDAATLIAAHIQAGVHFQDPIGAMKAYFMLTNEIFKNNQSLRSSITLPVSSAAKGPGVSPTPVPTTSPAKEAAEKSGGSEVKAAGDDREWGAKPEGKPADAPCSHVDRSPLKPDGGALPNGFMRCLRCGAVSK